MKITKKILATLLVLITLFTATTGLAAFAKDELSLEDKLKEGLWLSGTNNYTLNFFEKDGKLFCSLQEFSEGYFDTTVISIEEVEILSGMQARIGDKIAIFSFSRKEWESGDEILMTMIFGSVDNITDWITKSSAAFDDLS